MGIAGGEREVRRDQLFHVLDGGLPFGGDGLFIVAGGGEYLGTGKQEGGSKAQQQEVEAGVVAAYQLFDTIDQRDDTCHNNGQSHPAVGGIGALVDPLGFGGSGQTGGLLRERGQVDFCLLQLFPALLGLWCQLLQVAGLFPLPLLPQAALRLHAVGGNIRQELGDVGDHHIHILLPLEVALLTGAIIQLHNQVRDGTKEAFAGEATLAHGHTLENPADRGQGYIVPAVKIKAVEIQGLVPHAAGTVLLAEFLIDR